MTSPVLYPTEHLTEVQRRFPIGAEVVGNGLVHFRVWAPAAQRVEVVFSNGSIRALRFEGHGYFSAHAFVLRFFGVTPADDRLLIVNLGAELNRSSFAEPLIAPPASTQWCATWSSEDPKYGGAGTRDLWPEGTWSIPAECALGCAPGSPREQPNRSIQRRTA